LAKLYGKKVFEAYVQQNTPGAYRVFWYYGPDEVDKSGKRPVITIIAITPHPEDKTH
jgi:3'-phosphoadenosine 5'-phosphosulfate sulfotransferase